ncbi:MAG: hypothetical protein A1D16_16630 [Flavihumibacter sp. CACIAM 22H1]|nr:MAG: hypothetical protein A1D16_16630 [Flavihumibacter sp. CACIAM 22H1]
MSMKISTAALLPAFILPILFLSSCTTRDIFRSPYTNQQNSYHVMPLLSDEKKTANYLTASATLGGSNDYLTDEVYIFQGKWHVSHQFGSRIQGYFGLHGSAGLYDISSNAYSTNDYDPATGQPIEFNGPKGNKFTGSFGSTAGLAVVIPLGNRAEWRVFGLESSIGREWGDYYKARRSLPDSVIDIADRRNTHLTLGGFTEWVFKPRNPDIRFGYQLAIGSSLHRLRNDVNGFYNFTPFYINNTFHFTVRRTTGIIRFAAGNYFGAVQTGFSYRL